MHYCNLNTVPDLETSVYNKRLHPENLISLEELNSYYTAHLDSIS
jgi:hypothetical protein